MRRAIVTGGTGLVGPFIVDHLLVRGWQVCVTGRSRSPSVPSGADFHALSLDPDEDFDGLPKADVLIHAAFDHVPGRYRGGEGDDPDRFVRCNLDGSTALFEAAKKNSVGHLVFLSSRAVYGQHPPGHCLTETTPPRPDTLYGSIKWKAEQALAALAGDGFLTTSLRVTGVYGPPPPDRPHKWSDLFARYHRGEAIEPRCGTEVHGTDLASAVQLVLDGHEDRTSHEVYNVSDITLDQHDLLARVRSECGSDQLLTERADCHRINVMNCDRLRALGWRPGGQALLHRTVRALCHV